MNFPTGPAPRNQPEQGYFHLTPEGWTRGDAEPYPADRVETWKYESECPSPSAKTSVHLTRIWISPKADPKDRMALHFRYGEPIEADVDRNVLLGCRV